MARDFAREFYGSREWQRARELKLKSCGGLCERCLKRGVIAAGKVVHHKIWLTPENIRQPRVALNPANLEVLCQDCHNAEHSPNGGRRFRIGPAGEIIPKA